MKTSSFFLAFLLMLGQVSAQDFSPPPAAHLLGSHPMVVFHWPGRAQDSYLLQVYGSGKEFFSGEVEGTTRQLELRPGLRYVWKVSLNTDGHYRPIVEDTSFQLSTQVVFQYPGTRGRNGRNATGPGQGRRVVDGEPGLDGGPGLDLKIHLSQAGDYVLMELKGPPANQRFLLIPGTDPLQFDCSGGDGGRGGNGSRGAPGDFDARGFTGSSGGDGGDGGAGGHGGRVEITSEGVEAKRYLEVVSRGGRGGKGGLGGRPGSYPNLVPVGARATLPTEGEPGRPGADGQPGRIIWR